MRFFAIGGTILFATVWGTNLLTGGTASKDLPALAPLPPLAEPGRVRVLIGQLDDRRFEVRREADRVLRKMPTAIVPLLQAELKTRPSLEVSRRLESIIQELSRVPWQSDLAAATAEARRTGKPLLVFSADRRFGDPSMPMTTTFADLELVGTLRAQFVPVWHVQTRDRIPRIVRIGSLGRNTEENQKIFWPAQNARSYFCTPEGRVLHYVEGTLDAKGYRAEVRHARQIARQVTTEREEEGFEIARAALIIRDASAAHRRHAFNGLEDQLQYEGSATLVPDLIGQPVAPILRRLRAIMVQLGNGC